MNSQAALGNARFDVEGFEPQERAEYYNTDCGNKQTIQTRVIHSPHR